jgi:biopolymer transport protein ExbD
MSFIPDEEFKSKASLNLAPMIDFLFLMLMFFATLAVTRITTKDTDIDLVEIKPETKAKTKPKVDSDQKIIHIAINSEGQYKWVTELNDYQMENPEAIALELRHQQEKGLLPEDKSNTHVLFKIDKNATWEPILKAIFAVREEGYEVRPVYTAEQ